LDIGGCLKYDATFSFYKKTNSKTGLVGEMQLVLKYYYNINKNLMLNNWLANSKYIYEDIYAKLNDIFSASVILR
jgi:hypothetical protein